MNLRNSVIFPENTDPEINKMFPYLMRAVSPEFSIVKNVRLYTGEQLYPNHIMYQVFESGYKYEEFYFAMKAFCKEFKFKGFFIIHTSRRRLRPSKAYLSWYSAELEREMLLGEVRIDENPSAAENTLDYSHARPIMHINYLMLQLIASEWPEIDVIRADYHEAFCNESKSHAHKSLV